MAIENLSFPNYFSPPILTLHHIKYNWGRSIIERPQLLYQYPAGNNHLDEVVNHFSLNSRDLTGTRFIFFLVNFFFAATEM